jgi:hypothetical protein
MKTLPNTSYIFDNLILDNDTKPSVYTGAPVSQEACKGPQSWETSHEAFWGRREAHSSPSSTG